MKKYLMILMLCAIAVSTQAQKKVVEDSLSVAGNCTMCKMRIEAAVDLDGVKYAQ